MDKHFEANVLVVDDELGPRESLKMILYPYYRVFTAPNGLEALKIIKENQIDLVTIDYKMPGMTGTEVLREIRKIDDEMAVIMITGFGTMKSAVEGIRYGLSDYLVKPFEVTEILEIVKKNLNNRKSKSQMKKFVNELIQALGLDIPNKDFSNFGTMRAYILKKMEIYLAKDFSPKETGTDLFPAVREMILASEAAQESDEHTIKVSYYANLLGKKIGLGAGSLEHLEMAAWLHDIGLFGFFHRYLKNKNMNLNPEEDLSARKSELGAEFCKILKLSPEIVNGIHHQSERFDGAGLPDGLKGEDIPVISRIIRVSDQYVERFSELKDNRKVLTMLKSEAGKTLDPMILGALEEIIAGTPNLAAVS